MNESIRLGRIAGIPVGLNWTVGLIAFLLVTSLAGTILPLAEPGLSTSTYAIVGVIAAVGFFGSILAHELGHSLVAVRRGVPVDGITLWLLGGVARLRREPADARTELLVAGAGPATSVVLAAVFALCAVGLEAAGLGLVAAAVGWLATINVLLAVFNLVPAAPLDGGRILSGILWLAHGDRHRAKWTATSAGRGFAVVLIGLGAWAFIADGGLGLWPVVLGLFVWSAANSERRELTRRRKLQAIRVGQVMSPLPTPVLATVSNETVSVRPGALVSDVIAYLGDREALVVDDGGWVIGVVGPDQLAPFRRSDPRTSV